MSQKTHNYNLRSSLSRLRPRNRALGSVNEKISVNRGAHKKKRTQQQRKKHTNKSASKPLPISIATDATGDPSCAICLDTVEESALEFVCCGHGFHTPCLRKWLKVNKMCPICRTFVFQSKFDLMVKLDDISHVPFSYVRLTRHLPHPPSEEVFMFPFDTPTGFVTDATPTTNFVISIPRIV